MEPAGIGDRVEGLHAVSAALKAGRVSRLIVERQPGDAVSELLASVAGVPVREVGDLRKVSVTSAPQGIMADCQVDRGSSPSCGGVRRLGGRLASL